jgi:hypothetical protein
MLRGDLSRRNWCGGTVDRVGRRTWRGEVYGRGVFAHFVFCFFLYVFFLWVVVLVGVRSGRLVVDFKGQPEKQFQGVGQEAESRNLLFSAVSTGSAKE